jgi:ABC-type anion transport system, duplicated permease component
LGLMDNLKLGFWTKMRKIILPATFPYIIAGMSSTINSAWGGLAIGEYWPDIYQSQTLEVRTGLMKALAVADNQGNLALVGWLSLIFAIIVVIYSVLFTRKMMDLARKKYVAEEGIYAA